MKELVCLDTQSSSLLLIFLYGSVSLHLSLLNEDYWKN